ncbi:SRPBCC family protein [Virgibacillus oceani]|uniref:ATPase n=1 Tax=Virgibacillus oceani TaxID=1479511 RepID=A0A917HA59_9BACI|nr:SRPBCC family protein [Virgibacillus oceani]GGG72223.1 ATPase [Virgibacillus oceani]
MNNSTFAYETYIATTQEKLWVALTSGEFTEKYWFGREVKSDWKEDSSVIFLDKNGKTTDHGKVLKSKPYSVLSYTMQCVDDQTDYEQTPRVTFELKPMGSTVKLTLKHEYLSTNAFQGESEGFYGINNGWPAILSNLKSLLETDKILPEIVL